MARLQGGREEGRLQVRLLLEAVRGVQVRESTSMRTRGGWGEELRGLGAQRNTEGTSEGPVKMPGCLGHTSVCMIVTNQVGGAKAKLEENVMGATENMA